MPAPLRRFQMPPRPLDDLGGPPPIDLGGGIPYAGGVDYPDAGGPPPLTLENMAVPQDYLNAPMYGDLGWRPPDIPESFEVASRSGLAPGIEPSEEELTRVFGRDLALAAPGPSANSAFIPTEEDLRLPANRVGLNPQRPSGGGLRRVLAKVLPIARELAASTAAGASQPTAIGGLGAGLATSEQRAQQQQMRDLKAIHDWQKMQIEAQKTQAEIEKMGAETERGRAEAGKARQETELMPGREESQAQLRAAQAAAARDLGEYNRERARHQQALIAAGVPEAEASERAARAANYRMNNRWIQEGLDSGLRRAEAEKLAAERRRAVALAEKAEAETENMPEELRIKGLMADATYRNSVAALQRAAALAQTGQIRPGDILRATNAYTAARARLGAAMSNAIGKPARDAIQAEIQKLEALYAPLLKQQSTPGGGGPPALPGGGVAARPRAVNPQTGEVLELVNGQWVPVAQ